MDARRRLRLMLALLAAALVGTAGFTWLMNPYGRWAVAVVPRVYRSADVTLLSTRQQERTTVAYQVRDEQPSLLLLGSSRVQFGLAVDAVGRAGVLNAGLRGASLPEVVALLDVALDNPALRRVIWAMDFFAFNAVYPAFVDPNLPHRLRGETEWADVADTWRRDVWGIEAYGEAWRVLGRWLRGRPHLSALYPVPWPPDALRREVGGGDGLAQYGDFFLRRGIESTAGIYRPRQPLPTADALVRTALAGARQRGVTVTVVVLPMSACELQVLRSLGLWDAFLAWKRELLATAGPYWDFSGEPTIAGDESLFLDVMHFKPATGHAILRHLLEQPCDDCGERAQRVIAAGVRVDAQTIDAHLAAQQAERVPLTGHCAERVAAVLEGRALAQ